MRKKKYPWRLTTYTILHEVKQMWNYYRINTENQTLYYYIVKIKRVVNVLIEFFTSVQPLVIFVTKLTVEASRNEETNPMLKHTTTRLIIT